MTKFLSMINFLLERLPTSWLARWQWNRRDERARQEVLRDAKIHYMAETGCTPDEADRWISQAVTRLMS